LPVDVKEVDALFVEFLELYVLWVHQKQEKKRQEKLIIFDLLFWSSLLGFLANINKKKLCKDKFALQGSFLVVF
jgi:hypothetical protein